eukprot:gene10127-66976_t
MAALSLHTLYGAAVAAAAAPGAACPSTSLWLAAAPTAAARRAAALPGAQCAHPFTDHRAAPVPDKGCSTCCGGALHACPASALGEGYCSLRPRCPARKSDRARLRRLMPRLGAATFGGAVRNGTLSLFPHALAPALAAALFWEERTVVLPPFLPQESDRRNPSHVIVETLWPVLRATMGRPAALLPYSCGKGCEPAAARRRRTKGGRVVVDRQKACCTVATPVMPPDGARAIAPVLDPPAGGVCVRDLRLACDAASCSVSTAFAAGAPALRAWLAAREAGSGRVLVLLRHPSGTHHRPYTGRGASGTRAIGNAAALAAAARRMGLRAATVAAHRTPARALAGELRDAAVAASFHSSDIAVALLFLRPGAAFVEAVTEGGRGWEGWYASGAVAGGVLYAQWTVDDTRLHRDELSPKRGAAAYGAKNSTYCPMRRPFTLPVPTHNVWSALLSALRRVMWPAGEETDGGREVPARALCVALLPLCPFPHLAAASPASTTVDGTACVVGGGAEVGECAAGDGGGAGQPQRQAARVASARRLAADADADGAAAHAPMDDALRKELRTKGLAAKYGARPLRSFRHNLTHAFLTRMDAVAAAGGVRVEGRWLAVSRVSHSPPVFAVRGFATRDEGRCLDQGASRAVARLIPFVSEAHQVTDGEDATVDELRERL